MLNDIRDIENPPAHCATSLTRKANSIPSPLAGEGGTKCRVRGKVEGAVKKVAFISQ